MSDSPLPSCGEKKNCYAESRRYDLSVEALRERVRAAVESLEPESIRTTEAGLEAVFRVFIFRDDLAAAVTHADDLSTLHVRSASRVGRRDFGVNRRRVQALFRALEVDLIGLDEEALSVSFAPDADDEERN